MMSKFLSTTAKSRVFATMLTLGTATTLTVAHAIASPTPAQAGVFGSIKGAAKKVGGAVAHTASGFGSAAKAGAAAGKQIGVGVGGTVKRAAVVVGHQAAKLPELKGFIDAGRAVRRSF
jgi:hypothetical protein